MKPLKAFLIFLSFILTYLILAACISISPVIATVTPVYSPAATAALSFTDPYKYCANVGTIDKPDTRYVGEKVPQIVIQSYLEVNNLTEAGQPLELLQQTTVWRCMDGKVYGCNIGANLPCSSKANVSKVPTQAMKDYCEANLDSKLIPMAVTGHSTIFTWRCVREVPELLNQVDAVDSQGYMQRIWQELPEPKGS